MCYIICVEVMEVSISRIKKYLTALPDVKDIIFTVCVLAVASVVGFLLTKIRGDCYVQLLFILCVVFISRFTNGYLCGLISSLAGTLAVNYAFTYPYFKLDFSVADYTISFAVMLTVSVIIGMTTTRLKDQNKIQAEIDREKMSGNLLRAISHDIRTPLTSISGAVQGIIENRSKLDEDQLMSLLYDVRDEADRLVKMVENILTVTRIREQTGEIPKTLEAAEEIIAEAVRKFRKNRNIPVEIEIPGELLMIPMDPFLIEQVILNIMENSVIHGGATLIALSLEDENGIAVFRISDNGRGISEKMKNKLFSGYFIHADEKEGDAKMNMGIGLSVCSTIISAHGGSISAGNTPEGGAEFTFTLPLEDNNGCEPQYE